MRLPGVEGFHPLSPMQQGMLFHSLSAPGSAVYWQQVTLTLEGPPPPPEGADGPRPPGTGSPAWIAFSASSGPGRSAA